MTNLGDIYDDYKLGRITLEEAIKRGEFYHRQRMMDEKIHPPIVITKKMWYRANETLQRNMAIIKGETYVKKMTQKELYYQVESNREQLITCQGFLDENDQRVTDYENYLRFIGQNPNDRDVFIRHLKQWCENQDAFKEYLDSFDAPDSFTGGDGEND